MGRDEHLAPRQPGPGIGDQITNCPVLIVKIKILYVADFAIGRLEFVSVKLVDANGTVIPDNSTVIHFSMAGPGQVIGVDNGSNTDHDSFEASERKLFEGRAIAIVRAKASSGDIALTAAAEGVPSATIHLKAVGRLRAETFRSF